MTPPHSTPLAASTMPQEVNSTIEIDEQIRRRAFELYEQHGRKNERALDDWLQAEAELLQDSPKGPPAQK